MYRYGLGVVGEYYHPQVTIITHCIRTYLIP